MKLLKEMKKSTMEVGEDEKLKGKREVPFEKNDELLNIVDKGRVMKDNCEVDDGYVQLA